jgi:hypothetical protein
MTVRSATGGTGPGCDLSYSGFHGLGCGPRFGKGLCPKPLFEKEGPCIPVQPVRCWPSVIVKPGMIPTHRYQKNLMPGALGRTPGPGQYRCPRDFDPLSSKRPHATMGFPKTDKRSNIPLIPPVPLPRAVKSVSVQAPCWKPHGRELVVEATPGPGQYHPCDSSYCVCNNCDGISHGKTFGTRPAVYTGNIPQDPQPGPGSYHVECTTLGAAAALCVDA